MARKDAASKITLKVTTGVGADGKTLYKNRTINGLAPASLVMRTDTGVLED